MYLNIHNNVHGHSAPNTNVRIDHALHERMILSDIDVIHGEQRIEVVLVGKKGKIYKISFTFGRKPTCNCPDAKYRKREYRHVPCKHVIFMMLRVFGLTSYSWENITDFERILTVIRDRTCLPSVRDLSATIEQHDLIHQVMDSFDALAMDNDTVVVHNIQPEPVSKKQTPVLEYRNDECGFCLESLDHHEDGLSEVLNVCPFCTNAWHQVCFDRWATTRQKTSCIYCRSCLGSSTERLKNITAGITVLVPTNTRPVVDTLYPVINIFEIIVIDICYNFFYET